MTLPPSLTIRYRPPVRNQGKGRPRSRFYQIAHRIAERMEPSVAAGFLSAVKDIQARVDLAALRAAIASGNVSVVEAELGVANFGVLMESDEALRSGLIGSSTVTGSAGADVLEEVTGLAFKFNERHPNVILFARQQTAELVAAVSDDVKAAIRLVIGAGQEFGLTTDQQARAIRRTVGLRQQWAQAPLNMAEDIREGRAAAATSRRLSATDKQRIRSRIAAGTVTEEFIEEMQDVYTRSLVNRRAKDIARTETLRAAHHGQRETWKQAVDQEVLPPTVRRIAIVTPDDRLRDTHAAVPEMNPDGVGLDEDFITPFGRAIGPPWEPNCRCGEGLIFPGHRGVL